MASAMPLMSPYNFLWHTMSVIFLVFSTDFNLIEGVWKWLLLFGGICCGLPFDTPQIGLCVYMAA